MRKSLVVLVSLVGLTLAGCASGNQELAAVPEPAFPDPATLDDAGLNALTRLDLPPQAKTVEDAVNWLLEPTDYQLRKSCPGCSPDAYVIIGDPISPLAFPPQLTTIKRALVLVAGSDSKLVVDEKNKLISFDFAERVGR